MDLHEQLVRLGCQAEVVHGTTLQERMDRVQPTIPLAGDQHIPYTC